MATSKELTRKDPISGEATQPNIDKWAARASRESVQFSVNDPSKNDTMKLHDTSAPAKEKVRSFDQLKCGKD